MVRNKHCNICRIAFMRSTANRGASNPSWKGGRSLKGGYILVLNDYGREQRHAYVLEHIAVWEKAHGQRVPRGYIIHHLNGIKDDNRLENLAAMPRHQHHSHPREALTPYEQRIFVLEARIRELERTLQAEPA